MTLYYFENPFRKPIAGTIVRICQVLILPPYQRQNHGRHMLQALYSYYNNADTDKNIVEINVEDPAPAFTALRLQVDYERYQTHFPDGFPPSYRDVPDETFFKVSKNHDVTISQVQMVLKSTTVQIQMIYEIDKLWQLQQYIRTSTTELDEQMMIVLDQRYRLMVKQRLHEQNKDYLDESNKKQQLDIMYRKLRKQYEHILTKTKRKMS